MATHASVVVRAQSLRIGHCAQQVAYEAVEFRVGDEMCGLLVQKGSAEHAREPKQGVAAASDTVGLTIGADQLTLDAEGSGLQRDKADVAESRAI